MVEPVVAGTAIGTAIAATFGVGKVGVHLLQRAFGPLSDELGIMFANPLHQANVRRGRIVENAAQALKSIDVEPERVPIKVLVPILEKAGLEEDEDLATRWSALLANAANPGSESPVLPVFAHILSLLTPKDAAVLDAIAAQQAQNAARETLSGERQSRPWVRTGEIGELTALHTRQIKLSEDVLRSHSLIERQPSMDFTTTGEGGPAFFGVSEGNGVAITALGESFLKACTLPKKT